MSENVEKLQPKSTPTPDPFDVISLMKQGRDIWTAADAQNDSSTKSEKQQESTSTLPDVTLLDDEHLIQPFSLDANDSDDYTVAGNEQAEPRSTEKSERNIELNSNGKKEPKDLGKAIDEATKNGDFSKVRGDLQEAIYREYKSGGKAAVEKLIKKIDSAVDTSGVGLVLAEQDGKVGVRVVKRIDEQDKLNPEKMTAKELKEKGIFKHSELGYLKSLDNVTNSIDKMPGAAEKDFLQAGKQFSNKLETKREPLIELSQKLKSIVDSEGTDAAKKALEKLNKQLTDDSSPYKLSLAGDVIVLRTDGKITDSVSMKDHKYAGDETGRKEIPPGPAKDAISAIRKGDVKEIEKSIQKAFESSRDNPEKFDEFREKLKTELAKDGITVRFNKDSDSLSLHKKLSPHGVEFSLKADGDSSKVKTSVYDWDTKSDVKVKAEEVAKSFSLNDKQDVSGIADDKRVREERAALEKSASKLLKPHQLEDFKENLDRLAGFAKEHNITPQEVSKTLKACRELLEASDTHFSADERAKLAFQAVRQASSPYSIDQGEYNTCNVTTLEKMLYSSKPSVMMEMMRDIATTGNYKTANGDNIKFSKEQLKPNSKEEEAFHTSDGERSYATQIANIAMINAYWQNRTETPDGKKVPKGSIRYENTPDGERLLDYSQKPPKALRDTNGNVIESPKINAIDMTSIMKHCAGKLPDGGLMLHRNIVDNKVDGIVEVTTQEQFEKKLVELASGKNGKFPIIAVIHDTDKLYGKESENGAGHVVTISGIKLDKDGKILIKTDNQYGKDSDIYCKAKTFWSAMEHK